MTKQASPPSLIMRCLQANLGLTLIMLFFTVIGKLMGLAFGEKTTVGENGIELGPVRPYLEVVDDLKRTLRTSFHVEVEERNIKEIIEQAQEEVCVKSWETYKDVKAKVMAMAKELEIPTHKPARRPSSFFGGKEVVAVIPSVPRGQEDDAAGLALSEAGLALSDEAEMTPIAIIEK